MMTRTVALVCLCALFACGHEDHEDALGAQPDDSSASPSAGDGMDPGDEDEDEDEDEVTTGDDGEDEDESGEEPPSNFIEDPDGGTMSFECDVFAQDCPAGEKCLAWANDGGNSWNATRCSPIVEDPGQIGEPCTVVGSGLSGMDTCDVGMMCWNVDAETLEGTCLGLCIGDRSSPTCDDPSAYCAISCDGALTLCLPQCNPLEQDCAEGQACYPMGNGYFTCAPDASGDMGAQGDPCEFINVCDPGLTCLTADAVGCDETAFGCCTSYCVVGGSPCAGGLECMPYFNSGEAPIGLDDVGVCIAGA
jgi:hypothetical protein